MTAEACYCFLSGEIDFVEEHTALADCEIEMEILKAVWGTHRKFTRNAHKCDSGYRFATVKGSFLKKIKRRLTKPPKLCYHKSMKERC